METIEFKPDQIIIKSGEVGTFVYIIKSGHVRANVSSYEVILSEELPDILGIEALVNEAYTETCTAIDEVKVIRCSLNEFMDIYAKTEVGKKALESFMKRTAKAFGWI